MEEVAVFCIMYKKRSDVLYNEYSTHFSFYTSTEFKEAYLNYNTATRKVLEYQSKLICWIDIMSMPEDQANGMCCDSEQNQLWEMKSNPMTGVSERVRVE